MRIGDAFKVLESKVNFLPFPTPIGYELAGNSKSLVLNYRFSHDDYTNKKFSRAFVFKPGLFFFVTFIVY
jgi:hypothetical protein